MPLADKDILQYVHRTHPALNTAQRSALFELAKALRNDYAALVAVAPNATVTAFIENGENYEPSALHAGGATGIRTLHLAPKEGDKAIELAGLQNVLLTGFVFVVNLGPENVVVLDTTNVSGLTPVTARFDFGGSNLTLSPQGWMVVYYDTGSLEFVLSAEGGNA